VVFAFRWKTSRYSLTFVRHMECRGQAYSRQSIFSKEETWRKFCHASSSSAARLLQRHTIIYHQLLFQVSLNADQNVRFYSTRLNATGSSLMLSRVGSCALARGYTPTVIVVYTRFRFRTRQYLYVSADGLENRLHISGKM